MDHGHANGPECKTPSKLSLSVLAATSSPCYEGVMFKKQGKKHEREGQANHRVT
ncbi:hypothetical protein D3C86_2094240 [compost metagenome]